MLREDLEQFGKFIFTLEWLLEVVARYQGTLQFDLIHIDFGNPRILGEAYGAQEASSKLSDVFTVLRQNLRKTDLVARQGADFWILMPCTPVNESLAEKIQYLTQVASESGLEIVERDISIFSLNDDFHDPRQQGSGESFLAYLKKNHSRLARQEVVLPAQTDN